MLATSSDDYLSLVVKIKDRSTIESPQISVWDYSEDEYISFIQEKQIRAAFVISDDFSFLAECPSIEILRLNKL